jgi:hypothetical protein
MFNICISAPNRAVNPSKIAPLMIDRQWIFSDQNNEIRYDGDIVFKPGGEFSLPNGGRLVVYARTLRALPEAAVRIVGKGKQGDPGANGRDGNGGNTTAYEPDCRRTAEKHDVDGRPRWDTDKKNEWTDANVACGARTDHCDRGRDGSPGGTGLPGPDVELHLRIKPSGVFTWQLNGGDPGAPGHGGIGMRHHMQDESATFECPSGGDGPKGRFGPPGTCAMYIGKRKSSCPGMELQEATTTHR